MTSMGTRKYPQASVDNTCHSVCTCLHRRTKYLCRFPPTPQHVRMHTRKHAWPATLRGADTDAGGSACLLSSTPSTTLSTSTQSRSRDRAPSMAVRGKRRINAEQQKTHSSPSHRRNRAPSRQHPLI